MGGRKKKFIDKKRSATFQLLARDTSDSLPPTSTSDRVFVRVDNSPYSLPDDPTLSVFADEDHPDPHPHPHPHPTSPPSSSFALPDHVRREILELGLPDDGYNYLLHLREIRHAGGGSAYFHNDRARMGLVPVDVRAYDASRLRIIAGNNNNNEDDDDEGGMMCAVASGTVGLRAARTVDPDVARLLAEDDDGSRFGSDVEELEEDFVTMANREVGGGRGKDDGDGDRVVAFGKREGVAGWLEDVGEVGYEPIPELEVVDGGGGEKQRARRLLDAQFDLLALREYGTDSDGDDMEYMGKEVEPLAAKLNNALKDYTVDDLELEDKYRVPADYIHCDQGTDRNILANPSAEVLRKCSEYAELYSHGDSDRDEEVLLIQESSDESEVWDCETIVTTYSNLDNHPGKISAPEKPKKKLPELINGKGNVISLWGKDKIPLDFLPNNKRTPAEKVKKLGAEQPQKRPQDESKEAKKERKASLKEEKREARRAKKELKQLYRSEAQKAQQVAAFAGPSSIHLM